MKKIIFLFFVTALILPFYCLAYADNKVKATHEVNQDLISPIQMSGNDRLCLDGTKPDGKLKVDYWVDFECRYCKITEMVQFQQANQDVCIVIRHTPSLGSQSMPKALSYEALLQVNAHAANNFWNDVYPQNGISKPYQKALLNALDSILMPIEDFEKYIDQVKSTVERDNTYSNGIISYTPTFVIEGIRFTACDFNAKQLEKVLVLAKKAEKNDENAKNQIIQIITNGLNNEPLL